MGCGCHGWPEAEWDSLCTVDDNLRVAGGCLNDYGRVVYDNSFAGFHRS